MDLGLEFQKTNIEIRINIFEILCVHVCVCQFLGKTNSFDFSAQIFSKVDLGLAIQKTTVGRRISVLHGISCVPIFSQNKQL